MEGTPVEAVLSALADDSAGYPRKALDEAAGRAREFTPHLLGVLEAVAGDPEEWIEREDASHTYAAILLAHWREARAHPLFLRLFRLPDPFLDPLFGDMVTECFPALLLRTCGGSLDGIRALARERSADEYCRGAALEALALAVPLGLAAREEVVAFFGELLASPGEAEPGSGFWDGLANEATDLYPDELLPALRAAYDRGWINPRAISPEDVEEELARGKDATLADLAAKAGQRVPDDVHGYLRWSAAVARERAAAVRKAAGRETTAAKRKAKNKRKAAKAARRRNRR